MVNPLVWLVQPLLAPQCDSREPSADLVLLRFLTWRRSVLLLVLLVTVLTAGIDTATKLTGGPRPSFTILLKLEPESGPVQQTWFGDLAELIWLLSFYAMPVAALLARVFWVRPRTSMSILLAGWTASFFVPVAIALTPWSWWKVALLPPATLDAGLARQYERVAEGLGWGYYYVVVLSPAVLALVPGFMRACLRVKTLLPEATLPGWFLVAAAPFNGLLVLVIFVGLARELLVCCFWPGCYSGWRRRSSIWPVRAPHPRPLSSVDELRNLRRVQALAWSLAIASVACLLTYAATWEIFGLRLVGLDPESSLYRPWQLVRYLLDFSGRALFVTVLVLDLLLRATLSACRHQRAFQKTPAAEEYDGLMKKLEEMLS